LGIASLPSQLCMRRRLQVEVAAPVVSGICDYLIIKRSNSIKSEFRFRYQFSDFNRNFSSEVPILVFSSESVRIPVFRFPAFFNGSVFFTSFIPCLLISVRQKRRKKEWVRIR
jgi:hypothetical protein